ncbi:metallo-beta-lactamase family protein [Constrictibacter sp. MBR-5]|jgi:metallo-beta-lactamase family protein|uniref:MBL fold metallo-hydrolase n=1 Tax=Constrictibacter sp. MBR-5 TaxID=3156467 RepID=UPI00339822AB
MSIALTFCGAAGTVTGSCILVEVPRGDRRPLRFLVDCGMFQGSKTLKELNYGPLPFDAREIEFVLLTHAHIDHSGLLPKLVRDGFGGPIHTTAPTRDLLTFMLPDSAFIQEGEVRRLNRRNAQRGKPEIVPIYTAADADACLDLMRTVAYEAWTRVAEGVRVRFWNAGHILGSASIEVEIAASEAGEPAHRILFSGDIGPEHKLFHPDPDAPQGMDVVVCEGTYGGRTRERVTPEQRRKVLAREVRAALDRRGMMLIPAFAVERTQELLADLALLLHHGELPKVPVFLDSPLAIRATGVFGAHAEDLEDLKHLGEAAFLAPNFHFAETVEQSKAIDRFKGGAIVIAGSGMCEAGRIRHHLKSYLWRPDTTVMLVGYQAPATLGRLLAEGADVVRIQGEEVEVKAAIRQTDVYSGHADGEGITEWIRERLPIRQGLFLVHGEATALAAQREAAIAAGVPADRTFVPELDERVEIPAGGGQIRRALPTAAPGRRLRPETVGGQDWHNDYARLTIALRQALEHAPDDAARKRLLAEMARLLG